MSRQVFRVRFFSYSGWGRPHPNDNWTAFEVDKPNGFRYRFDADTIRRACDFREQLRLLLTH